MMAWLQAVIVGMALGHTQLTTPQPVKITLNNGTPLIVQREPHNPFVSIAVFIRAGMVEEPLGQRGVSNLVASTLLASNSNQSASEVSDYIEAVGGNLQVKWAPDYVEVSCVCAPESFGDAAYVIGQAIENAKFQPNYLSEAKSDILSEVLHAEHDPYAIAYQAARSVIFENGFYREPFLGTPSDIQRLTQWQALRFYARWFTPHNTVAVVVGDISPTHARHVFDDDLYDYTRPDFNLPTDTPGIFQGSPNVLIRYAPVRFETVMVAYPAPGTVSPDHPAFAVLNALVGAGKTSRLFTEIRGKLGIGYVVESNNPPLWQNSLMMAYVEYDPKVSKAPDGRPITANEVAALIRKQVNSILSSPPTPEELMRARRLVVGDYLRAHQRTSARAFYLGFWESSGTGYNYDTDYPLRVRAVTMQDVERMAHKYLTHYVTVIVRPEQNN